MKRKKTKTLTVFTRNSYKGRLKGVLPAFLPGRCPDLTQEERVRIVVIQHAIETLLALMEEEK
jgi:hypothetical protein